MPWIYLKQFYPIHAQTSDKNKIPCNTYTVIYNKNQHRTKNCPIVGQPRKELFLSKLHQPK